MIRSIIHIILHFIVPGAAAWIIWPRQWKKAWLIMVLTMAVDADHFLANPIYDPNRCSVGFHPLHSYPAIIIYFAMTAMPKKIRWIAWGLIIHMFLDATDCIWQNWS